eukprot:SAG25_NODE_11979_length_290_cov_1.062827_2_plen_23_part_01
MLPSSAAYSAQVSDPSPCITSGT